MNTTNIESIQPKQVKNLMHKEIVIERLAEAGIHHQDQRLHSLHQYLDTIDAKQSLSLSEISERVPESRDLLHKALRGDLVIPRFAEFRSMVEELFGRSKTVRGGQVADYIPALKQVNPELYGLSICTIDGQQLNLGDARARFCIQSASKPALYCAVLDLLGQDLVHRYIGWEPSGRSFNELALNQQSKPHNPMINAGAIMSASLLMPDAPTSERFDYLLKLLAGFFGNRRPGFNNSVYLSERETANRNYALAYYMKEVEAFPQNTDIDAALDLYFSACSVEATAQQMALQAATLANSGVCPLTGKRIVKETTAKNCLSMMYSCGMYDYSGEFAFSVGMPAKSGVSGVIMAVIPNLLGISVYSPRIDAMGNSVRGVDFMKQLVETFNFHNYDSLTRSHKIDPRVSQTPAMPLSQAS